MSRVRLFAYLVALLVAGNVDLAAAAGMPPVTSGLQLWLDASDPATLTDGSGRHPGEIGFTGEIAQWTDKSGNGYMAVSPSGNRPPYLPTGMNGQPTLVFNTQEFFDLSGTVLTSQETTFFVIRMFDNGNNRGPVVGEHLSRIGFLNDADRWLFETDGGSMLLMPSPAPLEPTLVVSRREASQVTVFENGVQVVTGSIGGLLKVNAVGVYFREQLRKFYGQISAILIYDRPLSADEISRVGSFLAATYSLDTMYTRAQPPFTGAAVRCQQSIGRTTGWLTLTVHSRHTKCLDSEAAGSTCDTEDRDRHVATAISTAGRQLSTVCREVDYNELGFPGSHTTITDKLLQSAVNAANALIRDSYVADYKHLSE
jgi:hypothetical protein